MSNNKLIKDYFYNLSYQILAIILPLITIPYISRTIGAEGIGAFSYTQSIVSYFILVGNLGINTYGQRMIAYNKDNQYKRSELFREIFLLKLFTIAFALVSFGVLLTQVNEFKSLYIIQSISLIACILDISWFFLGMEEFKRIVLRNFIVKTLGLACIFIFVRDEKDLGVFALVQVISTLIGNASLFAYLKHFIVKISIKHLHPLIHLRGALSLFVSQVAYAIYSVLDKTMIGILVPTIASVGFYEQAQKIIIICILIVSSLGSIMLSKIAIFHSKKDYTSITRYINKSYRFSALMSIPMMFGIFAISRNMVPWFYGEGFESVSRLLKQFAPSILFISISGVTGTQYLIPTGKQKYYNISLITGAIINFSLNCILIRLFKENGAALSSVLAEFFVMSIQLYFVRKTINVFELLKLFKNYIISGTVMFACLMFLNLFLNANPISTMITIMIGVFIYFSGLIVLHDELVIPLLTQVKNKLIKR